MTSLRLIVLFYIYFFFHYMYFNGELVALYSFLSGIRVMSDLIIS